MEGYKKHVEASQAPPPLTADEHELKMIKESEVSYIHVHVHVCVYANTVLLSIVSGAHEKRNVPHVFCVGS